MAVAPFQLFGPKALLITLTPLFSLLDFCNALLTGLTRLLLLADCRRCVLNTDYHSAPVKPQSDPITQNPPQLFHFTLSKSQRLTWSGRIPSPTSSSTLHLAHCSLATWASLPLHEHSRHILSSGILHWLFLLPGTRSADICMTFSHTSIRSLFKCHQLSKACQEHPNFKLQSSLGMPYSPSFTLLHSI